MLGGMDLFSEKKTKKKPPTRTCRDEAMLFLKIHSDGIIKIHFSEASYVKSLIKKMTVRTTTKKNKLIYFRHYNTVPIEAAGGILLLVEFLLTIIVINL
jgi:hypothetical protein